MTTTAKPKKVPNNVATRKAAEAAESAAALRRIIKPGKTTVYTVLRHCSASGMFRRIDLYIMRNGEPRYITYHVAKVIGEKVHEKGGIGVGGCGMDMGFHLVYQLGYCLWPKGTKKPHGTRNGEPDIDGGYAIKHRWL